MSQPADKSSIALLTALVDWFRDKTYAALTPRIVQHQLAQLDDLDHTLRVFATDIERVAREQEPRVDRCLDSEDVRLALRDLRERMEQLVSTLRVELIDPDQLQRFLDTARDLGISGIRTAESADEVADAISRAVDNVVGYMYGNGLVGRRAQALTWSTVTVIDVRKMGSTVTVGDLAAWRRRCLRAFDDAEAQRGRAWVADDRPIVA